jgi:hypothetical protein
MLALANYEITDEGCEINTTPFKLTADVTKKLHVTKRYTEPNKIHETNNHRTKVRREQLYSLTCYQTQITIKTHKQIVATTYGN